MNADSSSYLKRFEEYNSMYSNKYADKLKSDTAAVIADSVRGNYLYGPDITGRVPVDTKFTLSNGTIIYASQRGDWLLMVDDKGVSKVYKGLIKDLSDSLWSKAIIGAGSTGEIYRLLTKSDIMIEDLYMTGTVNPASGIKVTKVIVLNNGVRVYAAYESPYTKMVASTTEAKYYIGSINDFSEAKWTTGILNRYANGSPGYSLIRKNPLNIYTDRYNDQETKYICPPNYIFGKVKPFRYGNTSDNTKLMCWMSQHNKQDCGWGSCDPFGYVTANQKKVIKSKMGYQESGLYDQGSYVEYNDSSSSFPKYFIPNPAVYTNAEYYPDRTL
jgi:hypothetical protein